MLKQVSIYSLLIVLLASCSSLKTAFTGNRQPGQTPATNTVKKETKFLNQIDVPVETTKSKVEPVQANRVQEPKRGPNYRKDEDEQLSVLQIKYAVLKLGSKLMQSNPK